jgi:hypothetical protein
MVLVMLIMSAMVVVIVSQLVVLVAVVMMMHVGCHCVHLQPSPPSLQKYDALIDGAPDLDFDCSDLCDARHLLNVLSHVVAQHSGYLHSCARMCLCMFPIVTLCSAAAAAVTSINMSQNCLMPIILAELQQYLQHFPALQHVNMSHNPCLGTSGVVSILSSLPGAWHAGHMRAAAPFVVRSHC